MNLKNIAQKEAFINEYKGNLFEYLVGLQLARENDVESLFHKGLQTQLKKRLVDYEKMLRREDRDLLKELPILAEHASIAIGSKVQEKINDLRVVGKIAGGVNEIGLKEADLLVKTTTNRLIPISIKLCKANSYINTKSGGVKSFFKTYFYEEFGKDALKEQDSLNKFLGEEFVKMGAEMYRLANIVYNPKKPFGPEWESAGLSHLPGQLPKELKGPLFHFYHQVISKIHHVFLTFEQKKPGGFKNALYPLAGFSVQNILQVHCHHKEDEEGKRYQLEKCEVFDQELNEKEELVILDVISGGASFELVWGPLKLQVRVKPMNVFTVPGLKINCSVKYGVQKNVH